MPKVQVWVEIPDGWELADEKIRCPRKGEWFFRLSDHRMLMASSARSCPRIIVRKTWKWPEWLTARCVFQTESGHWVATQDIPTLSESIGYWRWSEASTLLSLTTFQPPPCDDWKHSLQLNPNWKQQ